MLARCRALTPLLLLLLAGACGSGLAPPDGGDGSGGGSSADALPPLDGAVAGYALSFDGVNDYATAGNGGFPPVGNVLSIEMWVKYGEGATDQDFFATRLDFASGVRIGIHGGTIAVRRVYVDRVLTQAPTLPTVNQWHHVAYTFDLTTNALYVDGAVVDAQATPTDTRTPTSAWLGSIDGSTNLYKGSMDEVRVWTVARSVAEVQADMHHRAAGGETGLVAYWTFDDTKAGGRSLDASGLGNDVTLGDGIAERMPTRVPSDAPAGN